MTFVNFCFSSMLICACCFIQVYTVEDAFGLGEHLAVLLVASSCLTSALTILFEIGPMYKLRRPMCQRGPCTGNRVVFGCYVPRLPTGGIGKEERSLAAVPLIGLNRRYLVFICIARLLGSRLDYTRRTILICLVGMIGL